ncbi:hypothetical protein HBI84_250800, partial [Parastagonospora nodorum]
MTDEIRQDVASLQSMFHKLQLACPMPSNFRQQQDAKLLSEIQQRRLVSDQQLKGLHTSIENCKRVIQQHAMMSTWQIDELRTNLGPLECHQEHLGFAGSNFGKSNGFNTLRVSHPLKVLSGDEKYNKVGKNLYSDAYDFCQADADAEHVGRLTKKDMVDFYAHYISPSSPKRSKLS